MFHPLEIAIGLRYLRSRRRRRVVSFMSSASLTGIALGVAALIVILSVMNGLESELRSRLVALTAHASVSAPAGISDVPELETWLGKQSHVVGTAPYVTLEGMLASGSGLTPVVVRGVDAARESEVDAVQQRLRLGSLASLQPGAKRILIGRVLSLNLGVRVGDTVRLLIPRVEHGRPTPRLVGFTVAGVFDAGVQDYANLVFIDLRDASYLKGLDGRPQGIAVRLQDPLEVEAFHRAVGAGLATRHLTYSDWTEQHATYFHAIRVEKMTMTIILMFIVFVAAFNIVASLMMVVTDKRKDIAILRTFGLEPGRVARIFLTQGAVIGLVGTLVGTAVGVVLALNVGTIVPWLEDTFHFEIFPADVYYVTQVPSQLHLFDVTIIPIVAFSLTLLATIYPARRAAAVGPAEALRYE